MLLEELNINEVKDYLKTKQSIIIPFGSTEQHSYHLPFGTDYFIAKKLAVQTGTLTMTMVAPTLPLGFSPGLHTKFPGTISLKASTYINVVQDMLQSLLTGGFKKFLLLTGHGLNSAPLKTTVLEFLDTHDAHIMMLGYWELDEIQPLREKGDGTHCTILETSLLLYLRNDLVQMNHAVDEYNIQNYMVGKSEIQKISKSGVIAETTESTADKGERYYKAAIEGLVKKVKILEDLPIM